MAAIKELTAAEECILRAELAGFTEGELKILKMTLAKMSEMQILAGIAKFDGNQSRIDIQQAVGALYASTDQQIASLEWALKTSEGWD